MSRIKNLPSPILKALQKTPEGAKTLKTLNAVAKALDSSSRAGSDPLQGLVAASLLASSGKTGVAKDVVGLLRLAGAVGQGPLGKAGAFAAARKRFSNDLPGLAAKVVDLARSGNPAAQGLAASLINPLANGYDLWASQFNPLMSNRTVQNFVQDLVSNQLGGNSLVKDLSQRLGGAFGGVVKDLQRHNQAMQFVAESGLEGLIRPENLGRALSQQFGQFPLDFSPFRTLSNDVRDQIGSWANAGSQTLDNLRNAVGGFQGELRNLERQGLNALEDIEGFFNDPLGAVDNQLGGAIKDVEAFINDPLGAIDKEFGGAIKDVENFINDPLGALDKEFGGAIKEVEGFINDPIGRLEQAGSKVIEDIKNFSKDPLGSIQKHLPTNVELFHERAEAKVTGWEAGGTVGDPNGPYFATGRVVAGELSASAEGRLTADLSKLALELEGKAEVNATAFAAEGAFRVGHEYANIAGQGEIHVGASAAAQGSIAFNPAKGNIGVNIGGEAFAGARAKAEVRGTAGPLTAGVGAEAIAGVGVSAGLKAGLKNGKFSFGLDLGVALGIGFRIKLDFAIDFGKIGKMVTDGLKWLKNNIPGVKQVVEGVGKAVKWVGNAAKKVGEGIGKAAKAVGNVVKDVGKGIGKAAKAVGKGIKKIFKGW